MAYKVLSLKWRPKVFADIVGQDSITKTLVNAFKKNRVAQGYIFTGPRGVGKTTTARVLSMALNAEDGPNFNFDPSSNISVEIFEGRSLDVIEIDGASNRGIDEIRNLREQIKYAPMIGKYKVIIIDEVHMLTNPAFNALLRTLEEPPDHGKFIFCTTDIHKVPATIISRCQRFDFNRISTETIVKRISFILEKEGIKSDIDSLQIIARKADGSMRDGLSILDQVISFCGEDIDYEQTVSALGIIPIDLYFNYTRSIINKDGELMLNVLEKFSRYGVPADEINNEIGSHLKNLLYSKINNGSELLDMNDENKKQYVLHADEWDNRDLLRVSQIISDVSTYINRSNDPYLLMEITSLKLLEMDKSVVIDDLLSSEHSIEERPIKKDNIQNHKNSVNVQKFEKAELDVESNLAEDIKINASLSSENNKSQDNVIKKTAKPIASISLNIDEIQNKWKNLIEKIHIKKPSIASVLDDSYPLSFKNSIITIQIASSLEFHINMIEKNYDLIKNILNDVFEFEMDFVIKKKPQNPDQQTNDQADSSNSIAEKNEQLRDKIVDLFDGEILT